MKIKVLPQGIEFLGNSNQSLLEQCLENKIMIRSICRGGLSCAECRIRIVEGDANVLPPSRAEVGLLGSNYYLDGRRLACQVRVFGPITIDVTEQLSRSDESLKKVRGIPQDKLKSSQAVIKTMVLDEPLPDES